MARHTQGFGSEFMPTLEEGSLLFMPVLLPATSLTEVKRIMAWQDQVMSTHPAVASVAGKLGRADSATDPAPVEMIETTIMLKPQAEWPPGTTKASIIADLSERLMNVPGYVPGFLQPIENRILMTSTGIRAQVGVKIFGDNLDALQAKAFEVERVINQVQGATGVAPSRVQGKPYLEIQVRRELLGRYGLSVQDVFRQVEAGIGGTTVATTIKGRERWPIQVRLEQADRGDIDRLGEIPVFTPSGATVQLRQVADLKRTVGPNEIQSENGRLRVFVQANVRDRDLGGFVVGHQGAHRRRGDPGPGHDHRVLGPVRAPVAGPADPALRLPRGHPDHLRDPGHDLPLGGGGGPCPARGALRPDRRGAAPGVDGLQLQRRGLGRLHRPLRHRHPDRGRSWSPTWRRRCVAKRKELGRELTRAELIEAVKAGARLRLRPKVMTVATTIASLTPIFWLQRTGVEIMQPLAAPVVGRHDLQPDAHPDRHAGDLCLAEGAEARPGRESPGRGC